MSTRLFKQHVIRRSQSLDGTWEFYFPQEGSTLDPFKLEAAERVCMEVPGCWECLPDRVDYRGEAVAVKRLYLDSACRMRLVFKGISHTARVYVDGQLLTEHHNAYTAFECVTDLLNAGEHEVRVWISNAFGELSALHVPNDYYTYGGITRPVELQVMPLDFWLGELALTTERGKDGKWQLSFLGTLAGRSPRNNQDLSVQLQIAGKDTTVPIKRGVFRGQIVFDDVEAWSPDNAKLYELTATLFHGSEAVDDRVERFGFRQVEVVKGKLLLNGEPVFLMGVNRHEDHPDYGCAIPVALMRKDLELCLQMGCNAVRTSHYPNDERFLDLCDELGILVWEENHARGLFSGSGVEAMVDHPMRHPRFREQCEAVNREMVGQHGNHPSILMWGILNECDSFSEFGRECYAEQFEQIRKLDPSRPVTYASCHQNSDICQDLPDICGWNLYSNWYGDEDVAEALDRLLRSIEKPLRSRPLILSEFGGGAIPGYRDPIRRAKWSEERQADILAECLEVYLNHPKVVGVFIWQFCDIRVDPSWAMRRPRTMNNKGIVDEHRRPKLAFETVKRMFRERKSGGVE
ncbi:MAG: beta-galactosidase [Opitutales bacterium]|nr:beta-galactosidase [Opitutales bacterium]